VIVLRKKRPELPRPYKTWGYPITPAVFVVSAFYISITALIDLFRHPLGFPFIETVQRKIPFLNALINLLNRLIHLINQLGPFIGPLIILIGVPLYFYWRRNIKKV